MLNHNACLDIADVGHALYIFYFHIFFYKKVHACASFFSVYSYMNVCVCIIKYIKIYVYLFNI